MEYLPEVSTAPFIAGAFTTDTTITIKFPDEHFKVSLYPSFDCAPHVAPLTNGMQWTITTPILTGQSFLVRWTLSRPSAAFPPERSAVSTTTQSAPPEAQGVGS